MNKKLLIIPILAGLAVVGVVYGAAQNPVGTSSGVLVTDGTNIGIGTSTLTKRLNIGGVAGSDGIMFPDGTVQVTAFSGGTQTTVAPNVGAGAFGANTGGGNYSFPASVGIGTTTPAAPLHVVGGGGYLTEYQTTRTSAGTVYVKFADSANAAHGYFGFDPTGTSFSINANGGNLILNETAFGGNVGIGTASPSQALDVNGAIKTNSAVYLYAGATSGGYFQAYGGVTSLSSQNSYDIDLSTTAQGIRINGTTGNVGIGTTAPHYPLEVYGTSNKLGIIYSYSAVGGDSTGGELSADSNGDLHINAKKTTTFVSNRNILLSEAGGNIGIGTSTPAYPLSVVGVIQSSTGGFRFPDGTTQTTAATGGGGGSITTSSAVTAGYFPYWATGSSITGTSSIFQLNGNIGIGTASPGANLDIVSNNSTLSMYNDTAEDISGGRDVYFDFYGNTAAATKFKQAQIKVSASTATAGNQESRIDFYLNSGAQGNSPTANPLSLIDYTAGYGGTVASFAGANSVTMPSSAGDLFGTAGAATELRGRQSLYLSSGSTDATSPIIFRAGTTEKMRLTYAGNLGIATTTPGSPLTVAGTIFSSTGGYKFPDGTTQTTAAAGGGGGSITTSSAVTTGYFPYWATGSSITGTSSIYTAGGNISIGTTNTDYNLQLKGGASTNIVSFDTAGASAYSRFLFGDSGSNGAFGGLGRASNSYTGYPGLLGLYNTSSTPIMISNSGTFPAMVPSFYLNSSGNIGMGTSTPSAKLDVLGNILLGDRTSGADGYVDIGGNGTGSVRIARAGSGATDSSMVFSTTWSTLQERMRISGLGYVGIATTTPGYPLTVSGTSLFTGTMTIGVGGTGKLNVGTIDPPYTINGDKFATYVSGMTGLKEETTGEVNVQCLISNSKCEYVIDFAKVEKGSDLWLFAKTTNLKNSFDKMTVLLTPSFDGKVWYEKDTKNSVLRIFASPSSSTFYILHSTFSVSYRLTAPRFDAAKWTNNRDENDIPGLIINY